MLGLAGHATAAAAILMVFGPWSAWIKDKVVGRTFDFFDGRVAAVGCGYHGGFPVVTLTEATGLIANDL